VDRKLTKERDARIVAACHALLPSLKIAGKLLRRKPLPPARVLEVFPAIAEWPARHHCTTSALEIATLIAQPGADATEITFAIVGKLHGVKPDKANRLYIQWLRSRPRTRVIELQ
jgi:hypothetical protein